MKTAIITQARMGSSRLPAKILKTCAGKPLLDYHIARLQKAQMPIYLATTTAEQDDVLEQYAIAHQLPYYRGSENDVLARFYECATQYGIEVVVRVTSDCPLIDGALLQQMVADFVALQDKKAYLSNGMVRTFPRGFDMEVFHYEALQTAYQNAQTASQREHVTPYIYQNPQLFKLHHFTQSTDKSNYRITLDTPEDYELIRILIEDYAADQLNHSEITQILDEHRELVAINAAIEQKKVWKMRKLVVLRFIYCVVKK